ncbi:Clusterin-like protein 1 [Oryzias melastigma]|uniref:Clusterin n=1 Tax=Oryzias melastigma TaxID=30732 RepID=A0A834KU04_ORYME|nr:Clusterin-like protein 1 [Oryzias melastigma]
MKLLLGVTLLLVNLSVLLCSPADQPEPASDILKQLSRDGETLVDEELRRALYGVKQLKEVMWKNEQKHEHLMKSLRHSVDKKKGAAQLTKEVTEKLEEAEERCKDSLQSEWEQCRPCLEDACKNFYSSTCRRGFATFHAKVENFFQRVSSRFGSGRAPVEAGDILVNQDPDDPDDPDADVVQMEDSFNRVMRRAGALVNRSISLVSRMGGRLDAALQRALLTDPPTADPLDPGRDSGFLQGVGVEEVLESFFDFGRSVVEEFGAVVTQVFDDLHQAVEEQNQRDRAAFPRFLQDRKLCRNLRRQTSECWQLQGRCEACQGPLLTGEAPPPHWPLLPPLPLMLRLLPECPGVRELHVELDEVSQLLEVSKQQYQEILSIVQRHADQTVSWISSMAAEFTWVARAVSNSSSPEHLFRITKVAPESSDELNLTAPRTTVEVSVLDSPPFILSVPGELGVQDPAFIQRVALEALDKYKDTVRMEDE